MKKIKLIIIAAILIAGMSLSSCSHKLCPAYADADTEQTAPDPSS